ncbi:MAG: transketolase family protein [Chloroflexi bacterium]|nr:transketolase family protein [Chloroflexota bacterium]
MAAILERVQERPTRDAYGEALVALGASRPEVVVLDAGVSDSTRTNLFARRYPERFFNTGIAEAALIDTAAGLALAGHTVFASTFAIFAAGRAWEQIRQVIAYPRLDVKIVATHAGISIGEDGASAQMNEDIALMRVLPNMTVLSPADAVETEQAILAAAATPGPVYVRLGRNPVPVIHDQQYRFAIGRNSVVVKGDDVTIFATGQMVAMAAVAARKLQDEAIDASVVNVSTIKPLDAEHVVQLARRTRAVVTVEEHSIFGGLGGAIAEVLAEQYPVPLIRVGVQDRFGQSGKPAELLAAYGLDADAICRAARRAVALKWNTVISDRSLLRHGTRF